MKKICRKIWNATPAILVIASKPAWIEPNRPARRRIPLTGAPLAMMLAIASPTLHATDVPAPQTKFSAVSQANARYDRFIITYKEGTRERKQRRAALQTVQFAVSRAGLNRVSRSPIGTPIGPVAVSYLRKLATGEALIHASRELSHGEANRLMLQLSTDLAVEHVQPDIHKVCR